VHKKFSKMLSGQGNYLHIVFFLRIGTYTHIDYYILMTSHFTLSVTLDIAFLSAQLCLRCLYNMYNTTLKKYMLT